MLESNNRLTYLGDEVIEVLKENNIILLSLHKIGSYYGAKFHEYGEEKFRDEYERETTRFIDDWGVTQKLANIRMILSVKFDDTLGVDNMDLLERAFRTTTVNRATESCE